jgi:hypothetical protein
MNGRRSALLQKIMVNSDLCSRMHWNPRPEVLLEKDSRYAVVALGSQFALGAQRQTICASSAVTPIDLCLQSLVFCGKNHPQLTIFFVMV